MAAVPVTIKGVFYPDDGSAAKEGQLVGVMWNPTLSIGGGPIIPEKPVDPNDPHPAHPIVLPGDPGWTPPPVDVPPPVEKLDEMLTRVAKPPPAEGGWGFFPEYGWLYKPAPGSAQPKKK